MFDQHFIQLRTVGTYHDHCTTIGVIEDESHHVGHVVHFAFADWVIKV